MRSTVFIISVLYCTLLGCLLPSSARLDSGQDGSRESSRSNIGGAEKLTKEENLKRWKEESSVQEKLAVPRLASRAERVQPAEFPYLVSIQVNGKHDCGGALISSQHVLTAAHCLQPLLQQPYLSRSLVVEVGSVVIGQGRSHSPKRLSYYRNYRSMSPHSPYIQPNDVAVITLATPVQESSSVRVIGLPPAYSTVPTGAMVKVAGFGNAQLNGPTSSVLQKSDFSVVSFEECHSYYYGLMRKNIDQNSQICAKGGYGAGTCQGDSGGPMVYNGQVVGLVSAGDGNCGGGNPDLYTKVSSFISYIQSEINGGDDSQSIAIDLQSAPTTQPATQPLPPKAGGGISPRWDNLPRPQVPSYPSLVPQQPRLPPTYPTLVPQQPQVTPTYPTLLPQQPRVPPTYPTLVQQQPHVPKYPGAPPVQGQVPPASTTRIEVSSPNQNYQTLIQHPAPATNNPPIQYYPISQYPGQTIYYPSSQQQPQLAVQSPASLYPGQLHQLYYPTQYIQQ